MTFNSDGQYPSYELEFCCSCGILLRKETRQCPNCLGDLMPPGSVVKGMFTLPDAQKLIKAWF